MKSITQSDLVSDLFLVFPNMSKELSHKSDLFSGFWCGIQTLWFLVETEKLPILVMVVILCDSSLYCDVWKQHY